MDEYPYENGDVIVLGPQVFVSRDEAVLNWKGCNYVPQEDPAERDRLRAVVQDITAHASPIAEDDDGFVAVGYTVTIGAIHRALAVLAQLDGSGVIGAPPPRDDLDRHIRNTLKAAGIDVRRCQRCLHWTMVHDNEAFDDVTLQDPHRCPDVDHGQHEFAHPGTRHVGDGGL